MAAPCLIIFVDGNEAKTHARDLKVACSYRDSTPISYRFRIH